MPAQPAAKQGDVIQSIDVHIIMVPAPPGPPVPTPLPSPFQGQLTMSLSTNVTIMGRPAATVGSSGSNQPPHIPSGGPFQVPPTNRGQIVMGSATVMINGKPAARNNDPAVTCDDVNPAPHGRVIAIGTVFIGG